MQRGCVFLLDPVDAGIRIVAAHGLSRAEIRRGKAPLFLSTFL
ncbi:MAG: hypothetical protein SWC96_15075 [Thermodesulfobacteriota bacterium]|nr:hypothetical protein [Thermodesulfobacteriota bacterium]